MAILLAVAGLEPGVAVAGTGNSAAFVAPEAGVVVGPGFVALLRPPELGLAGGAVVAQQPFGPVASSASVVDSFDLVALDFPLVLEPDVALPFAELSSVVDALMN